MDANESIESVSSNGTRYAHPEIKSLTVQPKVALADFEYQGFLIPEGAHVWTNTIAIARDKKVYGDPEVFRPSRYLSPDHQHIVRRDEHPVFGFGRR